MATDDQLSTEIKEYIICIEPRYKEYEVKCMQETTFRSIIEQINIYDGNVLASPYVYNIMWCPPGNNNLVLIDLDALVTLPSNNKIPIRLYCSPKNLMEKHQIYISTKSHVDASIDIENANGEPEDHNMYYVKVYLPVMIINQEHLIQSIASELKCDPASIKSIYSSIFKDGEPVLLTKPHNRYELDNDVGIGDMFVQLDKAAAEILYINTMKSQINATIEKFTKLLESV
jgi:hypothetical protein